MPELYIFCDEYKLGIGYADCVVCGTYGAAESAAPHTRTASGDFSADEEECGSTGGEAVRVAEVAGRFSHR